MPNDGERGLYEKFKVQRTDLGDRTGGKHEFCHYFVLDPVHDPFAREALRHYRLLCRTEYPQLGDDLDRWLERIAILTICHVCGFDFDPGQLYPCPFSLDVDNADPNDPALRRCCEKCGAQCADDI